jgi:hypothetical protein
MAQPDRTSMRPGSSGYDKMVTTGERRAMKYMLMICDDESVILSPAEVHALPQIQAWDAEVDARGIRRGGARLRPSSAASTVRVRDGEVLVSDGPFAETKEQIGGFDIIECASIDEAVDIAARHPAAASGAIEVRPLWQE